jgi:hypothetical protein
VTLGSIMIQHGLWSQKDKNVFLGSKMYLSVTLRKYQFNKDNGLPFQAEEYVNISWYELLKR